MFNHKLWNSEEFGVKLGFIKGQARALWEVVAEATVDVVMHYHQYSYDTSRPRMLFETLESAGLGSHLTMYVHILNKATGISVGSWKHDAKKLKNQERPWEEVLAQVETQGLESFKPKKETEEKVKQDKAKTTVKVESDAVRNAMQATLDSDAFQALPEDVQAARIRALTAPAPEGQDGTLLDLIPSTELRAKIEEQIVLYISLYEKDPKAAMKSVNAGVDAIKRNLGNSYRPQLNALKEAAAA